MAEALRSESAKRLHSLRAIRHFVGPRLGSSYRWDLLAAVVIFLLASLCFGAKAAERVRSITAAREPVVVHDRALGWAESPSLDATAAEAFVAYQAGEGEHSGIYLARVPRTGGVLGKPNGLLKIDGGREVGGWPSVALETLRDRESAGRTCDRARDERIWVGWSSCRNGRWSIKAGLVACGDEMRLLSRTTLSAPGGFQSQVKVKSACGVTCFVWAIWDRGTYDIAARIIDGKLSKIIKIYEGPNPVGRPDVQIMGPDRLMFAWDECMGGAFAVRTREMVADELTAVRTLDGPSSDVPRSGGAIGLLGRPGEGFRGETGARSDSASLPLAQGRVWGGWEPCLEGRGGEIILAWNTVQPDSMAYTPRAWTAGSGTFDPASLSLPTDDTWRVRCFSDLGNGLYLAWTTRVFFRSTDLYVRRVAPGGAGATCRVDFQVDRNFMNTFDCKMDRDFLVAWDYSGAIYLGQVDLSGMALAAAESGDDRSPSLVSPAGGVRSALAGEGTAAAGEDEDAERSDRWGGALDEDMWAGGGARRTLESLRTRIASGLAGDWPDSAGRHTVFYQGESLHVYFGDYHNHTSFSDGRSYPDISLLVAENCRRLDFAGVTDHDVTATPGELAWTRTAAEYLSVRGRFAALHGFEASKGWAQQDFGHWSVLLRGAGNVFHFEPDMTPRDLYRYARRIGAITIPHHVAKRFAPHNWDYFDPAAEPVVEMCSLHGIFESLLGNEGKFDMVEGRFVQDGLARGYVFGFVGGSDSHNCFDPATTEMGLTGVYAAELTPRAILDAMEKRRTFALTAGRTVLDFSCNGRLMGEELAADGDSLVFACYASSPDSIASMDIVSAGDAVWRSEPKAHEVVASWQAAPPDAPAYYYLRVTTSKGDYAWSSPIWIRPAR